MPAKYLNKEGGPEVRAYNPGQYPVADFLLGSVAEPSNEVPIGKAVESIINPALLTAGGNRMLSALKNLSKKSAWAKKALDFLESEGLHENRAAMALNEHLSTGGAARENPNSLNSGLGKDATRIGMPDYTRIRNAEEYGSVPGIGPSRERSLLDQLQKEPLPDTQFSSIKGGAGEPKYKTLYEDPNYEIRKSTIGFSNGKPFDTGEEKFWIYDKKNGQYTTGHRNMQDATNDIGGMDVNDWQAARKARDAEDTFSDLLDYYQGPTTKGHYTYGDVAKSIGAPGDAGWHELSAVPGGKSSVAPSTPSGKLSLAQSMQQLNQPPRGLVLGKTLPPENYALRGGVLNPNDLYESSNTDKLINDLYGHLEKSMKPSETEDAMDLYLNNEWKNSDLDEILKKHGVIKSQVKSMLGKIIE